MSGLGWIHFSDTTRRRVLKVIDLLGEKGAIDELGIGVVRNAFSNELFSGISTIMTRARYFYTVPYLLIDYLRSAPKEPVTRFMNNAEADMMESLTRKYKSNVKTEKIIGHTIAQKNLNRGERVQELVRKPSEIYWGGIRTFGIFKKPHSFAQLCQAIEQGKYLNENKDNIGHNDINGDDDAGFEKWSDLFDVPYEKLWNKEQLELTPVEAEHFKQRIIKTMPGSLLTTILSNPTYIQEFLELKKFYQLPETKFFLALNTKNAKIITTAIQFWDLLKGAHIRFNILLQNKTNQRNPISFDNNWDEWLTYILNTFDRDNFDLNFLWHIVESRSRVNGSTRDFIDNWIRAIQNNASTDELDKIVSQQEKNNKKERSKLLPQHLDNYDSWVGINSLEYRLRNVQTIIRDIANPLTIEHHS